MRTPTDLERESLAHLYDPLYAREYYLRTRELKGRKKGSPREAPSNRRSGPRGKDPRTGKPMDQIHKEAKAKQRKELSERIRSLSTKLQKLEAKIGEMEAAERTENRKSKAKKERAAKERDKPKTAAEKAEEAREAKKSRAKSQQKLKNQSNDSKSGGGSSSTPSAKKSSSSGASISDLRSLATKVRGQIAVAKQKLAAL